MEINHIIWRDINWSDQKVQGLLELDLIYHGGGKDRILIEGTFDLTTDKLIPAGSCFFKIDTTGVAGIHLQRVGEIV